MRSPPQLWKTVPELYDKIDVENVAAFKAKLKTFLFSKYFHQPLFLTLFFEVFQLCYTAISRKVVGKSPRDNPERYCGWF